MTEEKQVEDDLAPRAVKFLESSSPYARGETAVFRGDRAKELVDSGRAKFVKYKKKKKKDANPEEIKQQRTDRGTGYITK